MASFLSTFGIHSLLIASTTPHHHHYHQHHYNLKLFIIIFYAVVIVFGIIISNHSLSLSSLMSPVIHQYGLIYNIMNKYGEMRLTSLIIYYAIVIKTHHYHNTDFHILLTSPVILTISLYLNLK